MATRGAHNTKGRSAFKVGFRIHDGQRKQGANTYFLLLSFESWPQAVHTQHTRQVSTFKVGFRGHDGQRKQGANTYPL
jgi:hypothetical protein